ncbi:MAG TPA: hypothetical protein VE973_01210, partial [Candidatus Limnocylindria bacterium]|nr:hypothetical protein [Candidatus Limnocylindria bacterium]
ELADEKQKGSDALSRLGELKQLLGQGYNSGSEFYRGKAVPAEMVIALLENLAAPATRSDVYGLLKVMFANAKTPSGRRKSARS